MEEAPIFRRAKDIRTVFADTFKELLQALRAFQSYALDTVQLSQEESAPSAIKAAFELAHEYYKDASALADHLELWHMGLVEGRPSSKWTVPERKQDALIRGLKRTISASMTHLLDMYRPWLAEADLAKGKDYYPRTEPPIDHGGILLEGTH